MQDWINAILASIITGLILLIIEYRTRYFANFIRENRRRSSNLQQKSKRTFLSAYLQKFREQPDWAETVARARQNLGKIYGVHPNDIQLIDWRPDENWLKKKLHLEVRIPTPTSKDGKPVAFYNDFHDELVHHILVDQKGQILRDDWW